jgi:hypothetical protein
MDRSLRSVLLGTFLLRLASGLTGTMLVFYLKDLPTFGGSDVDPFTFADPGDLVDERLLCGGVRVGDASGGPVVDGKRHPVSCIDQPRVRRVRQPRRQPVPLDRGYHARGVRPQRPDDRIRLRRARVGDEQPHRRAVYRRRPLIGRLVP